MRFSIVGLLLLFLAACGSPESESTRTEAQRDSAIAESAIPGSGGVRSALAVSDSANARRALEDSIMSAEDQ
jgi:hypothetical protein